MIVPEAATLLFQGGGKIKLENFTEMQKVKFQVNLMKIQLALEDRFIELAQLVDSKAQTVLLCDRGAMDGAAYVSDTEWQAILDEIGLSQVSIREKRYDAVFHLVTAADGASEFYNFGNKARHEVR